jgi:hypothetical protein
MQVAALDLIAHASQPASPGPLPHLDNNHADAPAVQVQDHTARMARDR